MSRRERPNNRRREPGDASVGDLDGEYEIVVKQEQRGRDNSQKGTTDETKLEAYKFAVR